MDDGAHGRELWKSDGTSGGTRLVKDINAGAMPSNPSSLTNVNGTLFFTAREDVHGRELWKSDGTEAGAVLVANLAPGSEGSNVGGLTAAGDNLYFMYGGLWRSNGTTAGTVRLLEIDSTPLSEDNGISERISSLTPTPGGVYFQRDYLSLYGMSSSEVWFAGEGSARAIFDAPGSFRDSLISDISVVNDVIYFNFNLGFWKHEAGETIRLRDNSASFLASADDLLYFTSGGDLWRTDGTEGGSILLRQGVPARAAVSADSAMYFLSDDGVWRSDGTVAGTRQVKQLRLTNSAVYGPLAALGDTLFFTAGNDGEGGGRELWKSDGTADGTRLVRDVDPGPRGSRIDRLVTVGGALFFVADDGAHGRDLWKSNGTSGGTSLVADFTAPAPLSLLGDRVMADNFVLVANGAYLDVIGNGALYHSGPPAQVSLIGINLRGGRRLSGWLTHLHSDDHPGGGWQRRDSRKRRQRPDRWRFGRRPVAG